MEILNSFGVLAAVGEHAADRIVGILVGLAIFVWRLPGVIAFGKAVRPKDYPHFREKAAWVLLWIFGLAVVIPSFVYHFALERLGSYEKCGALSFVGSYAMGVVIFRLRRGRFPAAASLELCHLLAPLYGPIWALFHRVPFPE